MFKMFRNESELRLDSILKHFLAFKLYFRQISERRLDFWAFLSV